MKQNATYIEASIHPEKIALTPQSACFPQSELDFGICGADHAQVFLPPHNISK